MGVVLKARHRVLGRLVAIKMPLHRLPSAVHWQRFLREARSAARLQHPNICPIYEIGEQADCPFLAMGFIQGEPLHAWARSRQPSARQVADMIAVLARAVGYAHAHGVIHRDIKPANVLVESDTLQPVLMDFGLAKEVDAEAHDVTRTGELMGTPGYMAPEQAAGQAKHVGPATDVYALGAVLYELLCGRPPFVGAVGEVLRKAQTDEPESPRRLMPRLHRDLETICLKALAREPRQRYASAIALAEDLERFSRGEAILARRPGLAARLVRKLPRSPATITALIVGVLAVALAGYVVWSSLLTIRVQKELRAFDKELAQAQWDEPHVVALEERLARLEPVAPAEAAAARERLHAALAASIRDTINRSTRLLDEDVARIEGDLALLARHAPEHVAAMRHALEQRFAAWEPLFHLQPPFADVESVFRPVPFQVQGSGEAASLAPVPPMDADAVLVTRIPCQGSVRLDAEFTAGSWGSNDRLGLVLDYVPGHATPPTQSQYYLFQVAAPQPRGAGPQARRLTLGALARAGAPARLQIWRDGVLLQEQSVALKEGPLHLVARREGDQVRAQLNREPWLVFHDLFALGRAEPGVFGLSALQGARLRRLQASQKRLPRFPSDMERGDALYARREFRPALDLYQRQARNTDLATPDGQEARCKEGLCWLELGHLDEAAGVFQDLVAQPGERWPVVAKCYLCLLRIRQGKTAEAEALLENLCAQYRFEQLAPFIPDVVRQEILRAQRSPRKSVLPFVVDPQRPRHLTRALAVQELFQAPALDRRDTRHNLLLAYFAAGDLEHALTLGEKLLYEPEEPLQPRVLGKLVSDYVWICLRAGQAQRALNEVDAFLYLLPGVYHPGRERLLLARAHAHVALKQWDQAEKDLADLYTAVPSDAPGMPWWDADLLSGFLRERRGDLAGARTAWRQGHARARNQRQLATLEGSIVASLSGELRDEDADQMVDEGVGRVADFIPLAAYFKRRLVSPAEVRGVLREMWCSPRGGDYARRIAYLELPFNEHYGIQLPVAFYEAIRQGAFGGNLSVDQDAFTWQLCYDLWLGYQQGRLRPDQGLLAILTWTGTTTGFLGWDSLAPTLEPSLRARLAYVMGRRYLQAHKPKEADQFFRAVLNETAPGSPLHLLAEAERKRMNR
jgi:tetratricopeptide (TPR) repeat protein